MSFKSKHVTLFEIHARNPMQITVNERRTCQRESAQHEPIPLAVSNVKTAFLLLPASSSCPILKNSETRTEVYFRPPLAELNRCSAPRKAIYLIPRRPSGWNPSHNVKKSIPYVWPIFCLLLPLPHLNHSLIDGAHIKPFSLISSGHSE